MSRPRPPIVRRTLILALVVLFPCGQPAHGDVRDTQLVEPTAKARSRALAAGSARQPAARFPVQVALESIGPAVVKPKSLIKIRVWVKNTGRTDFNGATLRLRYGQRPLSTRDQINQYAQGTPGTTDPLGMGPAKQGLSLTAGSSLTWDTQIRARRMNLTQFGVYPIAIDAIDPAGRQIGRARTFVTFVPKTRTFKPTKIAWLWPLVDRPNRASDTTFINDTLEPELAEGGRLSGLVAATRASKTPVTWAIDPSLLDDARAMTSESGYSVSTGTDSKTRTKRQSAAAGKWLAEVRTAVASSPVLATPYADPDVVALNRRRMANDIKFAVDRGNQIIKPLLPRAPDPALAWPPDGAIDRSTFGRLSQLGTRTMVLDGRNAPPAQSPTHTPGATAKIDGTTVVAYDGTISDVLGSATNDPADSAAIRQRFLAETAMITAELPGNQRTLLVAPPRRWRPKPQLARDLLSDTGSVPWLEAVDLKSIERVSGVPRVLQYPKSARDSELKKRYLTQTRKTSARIQRYGSILLPGAANEFALSVPRMESSALREDKDLARRLSTAVRGGLDKDIKHVRVLADSKNLAGKRGVVPVSITNGLSSQAVSIRLSAISQNGRSLRIGNFNESKRPVTLQPEKTETIKVPMEASVNGVTLVRLQLLTPAGAPFGKPINLKVRVTGFGGPVLIITGGALAVLFLGIGVRIIRRRNGALEEEVTT